MEFSWRGLLPRVFSGFGAGGLITLLSLTLVMVSEADTSVAIIWRSLLISMVTGGYFGAASFLFQIPHWSPLRQLTTHFSLSAIVFVPLAVWAGWLPLDWRPLGLGLLLFVFIYFCFWLGFAIYYRRVAAAMNRTIDKK